MARQPRNRSGQTKVTKLVDFGNGIKLTVKQHDELVKHIKARLESCQDFRAHLISKMSWIDQELAGYLQLSSEDRKRQRDNINRKGVKPTDFVLQFAEAQIDECLTYMMEVMAPDGSLYKALAAKDKQDIANSFIKVMNEHAQQFKHYTSMELGIATMLTYNFGGFLVEWERLIGNLIKSGATQTEVIIEKNQTLFEGNLLTAIDTYNLLWDVSCSPLDLSNKGEFFALVDILTPFRVRKKEADGEIFGIDRFMNSGNTFNFEYYKDRPVIANYSNNSAAGSEMPNWISILSEGRHKEAFGAFEHLNVYIWLDVSQFGLNFEKGLQIYRIELINNHIVNMVHLNNAHGRLPIALAMPRNRNFSLQTKSWAEILFNLQRFASFNMNIHQRAQRKKLTGVTLYNSRYIPLDSADEDSFAGGAIPIKLTGDDPDIRKHVMQLNDAPDTNQTMADIVGILDLAQQLLPTNMLKQVTTLERATSYQAAATVQAANKRQHKIAKIIDSQCMASVRQMQYYNILQFQQMVELVDPDTGETIEINPAQFRDLKLDFVISDGLKGIDKLLIVELLKDIIHVVLQTPETQKRIDLIAIIDYLFNVVGDRTDFSQFKFKSEIDGLDPQLKDMAFQLLQQYMAQQQAQQSQGPTGEIDPNSPVVPPIGG